MLSAKLKFTKMKQVASAIEMAVVNTLKECMMEILKIKRQSGEVLETKQFPLNKKFYVSKCGIIFAYESDKKLRERTQYTTAGGYKSVTCYTNGCTAKNQFVHRMVLMTWVRLPEVGEECSHVDSVKSNNNVNNLFWCTHSFNLSFRDSNGTGVEGVNNHQSKLTEIEVKEIRTLLSKGLTQKSIAQKYGVHRTIITHINTGRSWTHVEGML